MSPVVEDANRAEMTAAVASISLVEPPQTTSTATLEELREELRLTPSPERPLQEEPIEEQPRRSAGIPPLVQTRTTDYGQTQNLKEAQSSVQNAEQPSTSEEQVPSTSGKPVPTPSRSGRSTFACITGQVPVILPVVPKKKTDLPKPKWQQKELFDIFGHWAKSAKPMPEHPVQSKSQK